MPHQDKTTKQYRVWLRPDTVKQAKLLALLIGRDYDWNEVADDAMRAGIAYLSKVGELELTDWKTSLKLFDLRSDLGLRIVRGDLPQPEGRD